MFDIKFIRRIALLCVFISFMATTAEASVRVYVNGMRMMQDTVLINDSTYVPLRAVSEALGANVEWDNVSKSAYITFSEDDAVAKVVEDVSPSVVTIIGNYNGSDMSAQYNNPTMHGSGVIYKSNGYIVTNAHVVENIKNLTVVFANGEVLPGKVLYSDEKADLAVVKTERIGLIPITMADSNSLVSGKTAIAIGTPISLSMRNSVTKGIISGVDVSLNDSHYKLLQTDASINPGNSGGPLLNIKGELIGINTSKYSSVGIDNMGFAIPVDTVKHVISHFEKYGKILRPLLDFKLEQSWEARIGLPTQKGVTVKSSSNPIILDGDVIKTVNGREIHSITDWNEMIKDTYNGSSLNITYVRDGAEYQIDITI